LRDLGRPLPAGLALVSPVADPRLDGATVASRARVDPMVRKAWVAQGLVWYGCPPDAGVHAPLACSLHGLPPMLVQVGDQEILHGDVLRLAAHAAHCGVSCLLEEYEGRWHVFHLQAFYLRSAREAIARLAGFAGDCVGSAMRAAQDGASAAAPALDEAVPR
uniref:alpha/beta hydrolase fold domain-containing protein n=1 Tax=Massilia sp. TaxID=1882437 RepID=UPI002897A9A2